MGPRTQTEREMRQKGRRWIVGAIVVAMWVLSACTLAYGQSVEGWVSGAPYMPLAKSPEPRVHQPIPLAPLDFNESQCPGGVCPRPAPDQLVPVQPDRQYVVRVMTPNGWGSGVIFQTSPSGSLILTNEHVVRGCGGKVEIRFLDGRVVPAELLSVSQDCDAACIRIKEGNLPSIPLAEENPKGGTIIVAGFGGGENRLRVVSGRFLQYLNDGDFEIGCGVRSGDSGGPAINEQGHVVGLLWGTTGTETCCVPVGKIRAFLARLRVKLGGPLLDGCPDGQSPPPPQEPPTVNPEPLALELRVIALEEWVAAFKPIPGPPGLPGKDGKDGKDATVDLNVLAMKVAAMISIPTIPSAERHYVVVADKSADYWPRLSDEIKRAQQAYHGLRVAPPPGYAAGPMPALVGFESGKAIGRVTGTRGVSEALYALANGKGVSL